MTETKLNGYTLKIVPDENPLSPREANENLGTFLMWHKRYDLGDKNGYPEPVDFKNSKGAKRIYASLPVYMLDHSGLRLSCSNFNNPWDSGWVGYIYCTKEQAVKRLGADCTPERAKAILYEEIKEYDAYLNGSYYGFIIEGPNGEDEDSCWEFLDKGDYTEMLNEMKDSVSDRYHPLFDKLIALSDKRACM